MSFRKKLLSHPARLNLRRLEPLFLLAFIVLRVILRRIAGLAGV